MLRRTARSLCAPSFADAYASTGSAVKGGAPRHLTQVQVALPRTQVGALVGVLKPFADEGLSLDHIQSRRLDFESKAKYSSICFNVPALQDDPRFRRAMEHVQRLPDIALAKVLGSWSIPWFPTHAYQLDWLDQKTLAAGADLADDPQNPHPGFHDEEYKSRRKHIAELARKYRHGQPVPYVEYTDAENATWTVIWDKLMQLYPTHACAQHNNVMPMLIEHAAFGRHKIPQLQDVSSFLNDTTGYTVRPVAGLLSSRDFFNALAFRVFFSTQYLRHHSKPLYTPEPDLCHELLGHAPLFADPDFADFSQELGLLSLGASDADIERLGRLYWYTVEFGLCREAGGVRAYGAGLLSSFGELEYCLTKEPKLLPWDPWVAAEMPFPITTYQPVYFVAESFSDALKKVREFGRSIDRPFTLEYCAGTQHIKVWPKHPL